VFEELGPIIGFGLFYFVLSLLGKLGQRGKEAGKGGGRSRAPVPVAKRAPGSAPTTLEDLLAEMRGELDRARGQAPIEPEWELEEAEGDLYAEPQYQRPEGSPTWNAPVSTDNASWNEAFDLENLDDQAAEVAQRRLREAEARNREWQLADHKAFDIRIRAPKPEPTDATRVASRHRLREAMILREVLGPPKALQGD
jgi:hypothetical protein